MKRFKKGTVVLSGKLAVLVTGPGDKNEGFPVFAGVVISRVVGDWPLGMYSDTWTSDAFTKTSFNLSKYVRDAFFTKK